ncbi:MAG: serine/threonine protein phosphatase, partial [Robiginitalea sp.]
GQILLIKWLISTSDEGNLRVVRLVLEGPQKLSDYKNN